MMSDCMLSAVFWTALCQGLCAVVLWISAGKEVWLTTGGICKDYCASSFVLGAVQCLAAGFGVASVVTSRRFQRQYALTSTTSMANNATGYHRRRSMSSASGDSEVSSCCPWTCVVIYAVSSAVSVVPLIVNNPLQHCGPDPLFEADSILLSVVGLKIASSYLGLLASIVGLGFACRHLMCPWPRLQKPFSQSTVTTTPSLTTNIETNIVATNTKHSDKRLSGKQPSSQQIPEAKSHVQECGGERVTVVTLTEAEGVVYAVPEQSYVVRRQDGSYAAPTGNQKLTAFFPSYTKKEQD